MDNLTLSYIAGFFDGEGSINITARKRKHFSIEHALTLAIGQKDGATLDWIKNTMGGRIYQVKRDGSYFWCMSNKEAYHFLKALLPFLQYKKPQAVLAIEFYDGKLEKNKREISTKEVARREVIRQELRLLHKSIVKSQHAGSETKRIDPQGM